MAEYQRWIAHLGNPSFLFGFSDLYTIIFGFIVLNFVNSELENSRINTDKIIIIKAIRQTRSKIIIQTGIKNILTFI